MPEPASLQETALDHLRVIRTLMERAHLYRAVSAPAALAGGALSLAAAAWGTASGIAGPALAATWFAVLGLTTAINIFLLTREAGGAGQPAVTEGLRMALRALIPPLLSGGILGTGLIAVASQPVLGALVWVTCYGLALQATVSFAPRSLIRLARAFLVTGQALLLVHFARGFPGAAVESARSASLILGSTFGLFHLAYGAAVLLAQRPVRA